MSGISVTVNKDTVLRAVNMAYESARDDLRKHRANWIDHRLGRFNWRTFRTWTQKELDDIWWPNHQRIPDTDGLNMWVKLDLRRAGHCVDLMRLVGKSSVSEVTLSGDDLKLVEYYL